MRRFFAAAGLFALLCLVPASLLGEDEPRDVGGPPGGVAGGGNPCWYWDVCFFYGTPVPFPCYINHCDFSAPPPSPEDLLFGE